MKQYNHKGHCVKVGDKVWSVCDDDYYYYLIEKIAFDTDGTYFQVDDEESSIIYFDEEEVGKTIFFDEAEARKVAEQHRRENERKRLPDEITINGVVYVKKGEK